MAMMLRKTTIAAIGTLLTVMAGAQEKSLVERLGYPPDTKLLIVHADDMGMSHNVNVATLEAMTKGWVSSASIMVPCPWFPEAAAMAREHPELDFGLHLTLTSEWRYYRWRPVSPIDKVRGLIDHEGYMWRDVASTARSATAEQVETEIRAQVQRAIAFGIQPTHLDTHMGTLYSRPEFFDAFRKVAHEFKVPYMLPRPTPELIASADPAGRIFTAERLEAIRASGDIMIDYLVYDVRKRPEERLDFYVNLIKSLKPGVTQLIIHCGRDTEELRAITGNWANRVADARAFTNPAIKKALQQSGVRLLKWRQLRKLQYGQ